MPFVIQPIAIANFKWNIRRKSQEIENYACKKSPNRASFYFHCSRFSTEVFQFHFSPDVLSLALNKRLEKQ